MLLYLSGSGGTTKTAQLELSLKGACFFALSEATSMFSFIAHIFGSMPFL